MMISSVSLVLAFSVGYLMGTDHLLLLLEIQSLDPCALPSSSHDLLIQDIKVKNLDSRPKKRGDAYHVFRSVPKFGYTKKKDAFPVEQNLIILQYLLEKFKSITLKQAYSTNQSPIKNDDLTTITDH